MSEIAHDLTHSAEEALEALGQAAFDIEGFASSHFRPDDGETITRIDERTPLDYQPNAIPVRLPSGNHLRTKTVVLGQGTPQRVLFSNPYRIALYLAVNSGTAVVGVAETAQELSVTATDITGGYRVQSAPAAIQLPYIGDLWAISIFDGGANAQILYVGELVSSPQ